MTNRSDLYTAQSDNWRNNHRDGIEIPAMEDLGFTSWNEMEEVEKGLAIPESERPQNIVLTENKIGETAFNGATGELSAKDKAMASVEHLRDNSPFNINEIPPPPNDGARHKARFTRD